MTLRRRLLLAVLPLGLLLLLLGGAGGWLLLNLGRRSDAILHENYDSIRAMVQLTDAADRLERAALTADRVGYDAARTQLLEQLAVENGNVTVMPDEPRLAAELTAAVAEFTAAGDADPPRLAEVRRLLPVVKAAASAVLQLNQDEMERTSRAAQRTATRSLVGFGIGFLAAAALAVLFTYRVVAAVGRPIRELTGAVRAVRGGDLTHRIPDGRRDEFGELASAFNDMAEQLWLIKQTNYRTLVRAREAARATIDSFPSPVLVIDPEGKVELANPAARRLFGLTAPTAVWSPPDALRQPLADALQDQRAYLTDKFDQALTLRADGGERVYLPQVRPIRGDRGDTLGAAVVLDDVTQFRLLDQLKGDFVATVGHELKTPLTGLRMAVHLLLEEAVGPLAPKQVELLIDARDNAERLFALVEQLLALARLEDRREFLALERVPVEDLFRRAADAVAVRAADKAVSVVVEDTSAVPPLAADPVRFGHALDNLLTNAVTYTPPGGTITLSAEVADGDRVRLTVADTGVGIPADQLPHVFEKFFRVPGDDHPPGTGLGLAIVREIVAAHDGDITCESTLGVGTTFRITMPTGKEGRA